MPPAQSYGISREDVYIDCLTLTVSAEQEGAAETLKALKMVKEKLGCKTVLGVSNISFGLPERELINRTFLTMALENGLDLPIINPNVDSMTGAVRAYKVLKAIDKNSVKFIETKDKDYWWQMIQLLPSSFNQKRTVLLNYEVLANIYKSRKGHKLDEWRTFCEWIKTLPLSYIITHED